MTIRQFYYTSCQHGVEGIQGFQVNATSPGIDRAHVDTGLRLSLYRPSPAAPSLPTAAQLDAFPVVVGYRPDGDHAVLFHSRYLGADFTGRQGNYFAHVLVLDTPERDLAGALPVDAWGSGAWRSSAVEPVDLPVLDAVPDGVLGGWSAGRYLRDGQLPEFERLLTAVRDRLEHGGHVVLVAPSAEAVARAVAAVTRSLPRALATAVSFLTFTSAPDDADVLVVGTSPDVTIPVSPFGDQTVLRLGGEGAGSDGPVDRYARTIAGCWSRSDDEADEAVTFASSIRPPVRAEELEELSHLVDLIIPDSPRAAPDVDVSVALRFGLRRCPAVLRAPVWARVAHHVERAGPLRDITSWSEVLAAADRARTTPPPAVLDAYLTAVLTAVVDNGLDPGSVWLPDRLAGAHQRTVADWAVGVLKRGPSITVAGVVLDTVAGVGVGLPENVLAALVDDVIVPSLVDPATAAAATDALTRMAAKTPALPGMVCGELDRLCADARGLRRVVANLPGPAADLLARTVREPSRCALALDVVAAREGHGRGALKVLEAALRDLPVSPADVEALVELMWPELPSAREAVALCRAVPDRLLAQTVVPRVLVGRLVADAEDPGLDADDYALADLLHSGPLAQALGEQRHTVEAVGHVARYAGGPPHSERNADLAVAAVNAVTEVSPEIRKAAMLAVASWVCAAPDALAHADALARLLAEARSREFVGAYRVELIEVLRGKPAHVAAVLPALACLAARDREARRLLDDTAAMVLTGRSMRDREAITKAIGGADRRMRPLLRQMGRGAPKSWPVWWDDWQQDHLRTSLMSRLIARRRSSKAVD